MCGKHFSQGLQGRERMMKRIPPRMRMAPAEPTQATDQDRWWSTGTERSLDSRARTDWWKTRMDRRTRTPVHRTQSGLQGGKEAAALRA